LNWEVEITDEAMVELESQFKTGLLTREDAAIIKAWMAEMETNGPDQLRQNRLWDDHDLDAEWQGYRSSCFSLRGRIIYRVFRERIVVEIVRVTASHDYRK
jgi:mRNA-degrading endonuclease YafQ of YafQ-DinJ toxin-antitoxin module